MKKLLTLAIAIFTLTTLTFSALGITSVNALQTGDTVVFLIRSDDIQPTPPATAQDGLTFTGRPASSKDLGGGEGGCPPGAHLLQEAALVDRDGSSGLIKIVVLSETDPVPAGTELTALAKQNTCTDSDGVSYDRYEGTATRVR